MGNHLTPARVAVFVCVGVAASGCVSVPDVPNLATTPDATTPQDSSAGDACVQGCEDSGPSDAGPTDSASGGDVESGGACADADSVCDGGCASVLTDNRNCGGCGIECGGACTGGRCLVTLASGQSGPYYIAAAPTAVYWLNLGAVPAVMSAPLTGVPEGGAATTVAPASSPAGIAIDTAYVYWTDTGNVIAMSLDGGVPATLSAGPFAGGAGAIAVDNTYVYWLAGLDDGVLGELPLPGPGGLSGATVFTLSSGPTPDQNTVIAVDATNVYWTSNGADGGAVRSVPLAGHPPPATTITTLAVTGDAVGGIAAVPLPTVPSVNATNLYWTITGGATGGAVMQLPLDGGAAITLASGQGPGLLAVDSTSVYWVTQSGTVMKVPQSGGTPTTLASSQVANAIAVDGTSVYWTNGSTNGTVMKLTPK